jgi:hypothetical protein
MTVLSLARAAGAVGQLRKPQIHVDTAEDAELVWRAALFLEVRERG